MRHFDKKGFTLVELLIVIAIMSVLSAIALPAFNQWRATLNSKEAAWGIASELKLARQTAITNNLVCTAEFNVAGNRYRLTQGGAEVKPWTVLPSGMSLTTGTGIACTGAVDINIAFSPRGSAGSAAVCVNDSSAVTRFTVHVSPTNGRVYID